MRCQLTGTSIKNVGVQVSDHEFPLLWASAPGYKLCSSCSKLQFCLFWGCERKKSVS